MKWDTRFLDLAKHVASWSKDPSTQCGTVIVRPDRTIASIGFNGLPRGVEDSPERLLDRDKKLQYIVHAEVNAILTAHEQLTDYAIYVWPFQPCCQCAAAIIQSGLKEFIAQMRQLTDGQSPSKSLERCSAKPMCH
jgi:dCMP deaminase